MSRRNRNRNNNRNPFANLFQNNLSRRTVPLQWTPVAAVGAGQCERVFALTTSRDNRFYIIYIEAGNLMETWWVGQPGWHPPRVIREINQAITSIALQHDDKGDLHMVYVMGDSIYHQERKVASRLEPEDADETWTEPVVIDTGYLPGRVKLVQEEKTLFIGYQLNQGLMIGELTDDGWQSESVVEGISSVFAFDFDVDRRLNIHVAYDHPDGQEILWTYKTDGIWSEPVQIYWSENPLIYSYVSLRLSTIQQPWVSFQADGLLQFGVLGVDHKWKVEHTQINAWDTYFSSFDFVDENQPTHIPMILFHDVVTGGQLRIVYKLKREWKTVTLDKAQGVGANLVVSVDKAHRPKVAYYDTESSNIKVLVAR